MQRLRTVSGLVGDEPSAEPTARGVATQSPSAVKDRTGAIDEPALSRLLAEVKNLVTPDNGSSWRATPPALSLLLGQSVFDELLARPELWRGKLIEVRGNWVSRFVSSLGPGSGHLSYLLGTDGRLYLVATGQEERELEPMQGVTFRGFFCHLYTGAVLHHGELRQATIPFLVGDDFDLLERPEGASSTALALPLMAFLGLAAGIVFVLLRRGR